MRELSAGKREEISSAINVLRNFQSEIAGQVLPIIRAWCEDRREWIGEAWLQLSDDLRTIQIFVGLLVKAGDEDANLQDQLSGLDLRLHAELRSLRSPWQPTISTMSFRVDEALTNYMGFVPEEAVRIFPSR